MALRGAFRHPKMRRLAGLLKVQRVTAFGIMEQLWATTADFLPTGAIGRLSNQDIADQLEWDGDADQLVAALVDANFLDELRSADRLYVHNWHLKNDNTVDARLYRVGQRYANGSIPRGSKIEPSKRAELFEKFYKQVPNSLFATTGVAAADVAEAEIAAADLPTNVIPFGAAPRGSVRSLPEPEPEPVPVPEPETPYPLAGKGGVRKQQRMLRTWKRAPGGAALDHATTQVMSACRFTGTSSVRTQTAIWMAIEAECKRVDKPPEAAAMGIAETMANMWSEYLRCKHLIRCPCGPVKFFDSGQWADDRTWTWDQQLLAQRGQASMGMR